METKRIKERQAELKKQHQRDEARRKRRRAQGRTTRTSSSRTSSATGNRDPIAGMHGAFAFLVALAERAATGRGHHVESTMVESALNVAAEQAVEWSAHARLLRREGNRSPLAAPQGAEYFVLQGGAQHEDEPLAVHSWLRLPIGSFSLARAGSDGAIVWCKTRHLRDVSAPGDGDENYVKLETPPDEIGVLLQKVEHPGRVHLDIETDDVEAEVSRLE